MDATRAGRMVLLPALGASPRLYAAQQDEFPEMVVPAWLPPLRNETLASYGQRMAAEVASLKPEWIGGCSFGGMVALEMARHLPVRGCVLLGSVKSGRELRAWWRVCRPVLLLAPPRSDRVVALLAGMADLVIGRWLSEPWQRVVRHLAKLNCPFAPWAVRAMLAWEPEDSPTVPVWHLHGDRDVILPVGLTTPTEVVAGGFHLLPLTHPLEVNAFLGRVMGG